jgi:Lon protease-like protein
MQLPLFPLHTVVFPHLPLPIHVFEERYRVMVRELVATDSVAGGRFAVSMITDGPEVGGNAAWQEIGTICEVRTAEQLADGRWTLVAVGLTRARLRAASVNPHPYGLVDVVRLTEPWGEDALVLLPTVQRALDAYLATVKRFVVRAASVGRTEPQEPTAVAASLDRMLKPIQLPDDPVAASYAIGGLLQIELSRKQQLLEIPDAASRLRAELEILRRESRLLDNDAMSPLRPTDFGFDPN